VPTIVVTAERDPSTEARCRAIGCAAFITKPCDPSQLIRILGALLPSPRLARTAVRPSAAASMGMKGLSS
jgi:CheY-like chemotaxis protein